MELACLGGLRAHVGLKRTLCANCGGGYGRGRGCGCRTAKIEGGRHEWDNGDLQEEEEGGGHGRGRAIAPRARVGWREIAEMRNGEGDRFREEEERPSRRGRSRGDER